MIRKDSQIFLYLMLLLLFFTACRSTKSEKSSLSVETRNMLTEVGGMEAVAPVCNNMSAKLRIKAEVGGRSLSSSGSFGVDKEQGMQISISALGLFEIARIEISPMESLLLNKMGKEYVRLDYMSTSVLRQAGLDYDVLKSVLMNEPFSPDGKDFLSALSGMSLSREADNIVVTTPKQKAMQYTFYFNTLTGELRKTTGVYNDRVHLTCNYSDFEKLDGRSFPRNIALEIDGVGAPMMLTLRLSNLKAGKFVFRKSNVDSYDEIDMVDIIESLSK